MTTNEITAGVPTAAELEILANSLFPDFDAQRCAEGIEKLAVGGDTSVINDAVSRAENYLGGYSDFERIAQELNYGGSDNGVGDVSQNGYSPVVLSENQAQNYTPKATSTVNTEPSRLGSQIVVGTKTLEQIRNDFPILNEKINGHPLVWLDNGATTQRPQAVIDRLSYYYTHENSNVHRGAHELAARSTDAYENARQITADFIGALSKDNIVFVRGTTEGINLVAHAYVKQYLQPGDEIILTLLEHHANIVPWQLIAQETGAVIKVATVDEIGQIILS